MSPLPNQLRKKNFSISWKIWNHYFVIPLAMGTFGPTYFVFSSYNGRIYLVKFSIQKYQNMPLDQWFTEPFAKSLLELFKIRRHSNFLYFSDGILEWRRGDSNSRRRGYETDAMLARLRQICRNEVHFSIVLSRLLLFSANQWNSELN